MLSPFRYLNGLIAQKRIEVYVEPIARLERQAKISVPMVFLMMVDVSNITAHRVVWCFKRELSNQVAVHINTQRQRIHVVVNERRTNAVYVFRAQGNIAYRISK